MRILCNKTSPDIKTFFHNTYVVLGRLFFGNHDFQWILKLGQKLFFIQIFEYIMRKANIFVILQYLDNFIKIVCPVFFFIFLLLGSIAGSAWHPSEKILACIFSRVIVQEASDQNHFYEVCNQVNTTAFCRI